VEWKEGRKKRRKRIGSNQVIFSKAVHPLRKRIRREIEESSINRIKPPTPTAITSTRKKKGIQYSLTKSDQTRQQSVDCRFVISALRKDAKKN